MTDTHLDTIIVGAGLSGIGTAYHLQDQNPGINYAILEARDNMGGTWDLFKYPGIRSDSDMYTLGFSFYPWRDAKAIADGPAILNYIKETAAHFGIDKRIRYSHKLVGAEWSSEEGVWKLTVQQGEQQLALTCNFLLMCSGYYRYEAGYQPDFPGVSEFNGQFIHPQQWPEDLDYSGKRVVVIGSGATAVTLVPEMAKKAERVTMLQRSPTYIASLPSVDKIAETIKKVLPAQWAHSVNRWKNILFSMGFYNFCKAFPNAARKYILKGVRHNLSNMPEKLNDFSPNYAPWDQRLCLVPDDDLFNALKSGSADIVTDHIEHFVPEGIKLKSGRVLEADIVVSATGLVIQALGGVKPVVDGVEVDIAKRVPYKSAMFSGIPNLGVAFGYTNASWTLRTDLTGEWLARVIRTLRDENLQRVMPEPDPKVTLGPLVDFTSGYFQRAKDVLPQHGEQAPWRMQQNYFKDLWGFRVRPVKDKGLMFE